MEVGELRTAHRRTRRQSHPHNRDTATQQAAPRNTTASSRQPRNTKDSRSGDRTDLHAADAAVGAHAGPADVRQVRGACTQGETADEVRQHSRGRTGASKKKEGKNTPADRQHTQTRSRRGRREARRVRRKPGASAPRKATSTGQRQRQEKDRRRTEQEVELVVDRVVVRDHGLDRQAVHALAANWGAIRKRHQISVAGRSRPHRRQSPHSRREEGVSAAIRGSGGVHSGRHAARATADHGAQQVGGTHPLAQRSWKYSIRLTGPMNEPSGWMRPAQYQQKKIQDSEPRGDRTRAAKVRRAVSEGCEGQGKEAVPSTSGVTMVSMSSCTCESPLRRASRYVWQPGSRAVAYLRPRRTQR